MRKMRGKEQERSWIINAAWQDSLPLQGPTCLPTITFNENTSAKSSSWWYNMSRLNNITPLRCVEIVKFLWSLSGPGPSGWTPGRLFNTIWSQVKQSGGAAHLLNQPMEHIQVLCNSGKCVEWASLYFAWPLYIILDVAEWRFCTGCTDSQGKSDKCYKSVDLINLSSAIEVIWDRYCCQCEKGGKRQQLCCLLQTETFDSVLHLEVALSAGWPCLTYNTYVPFVNTCCVGLIDCSTSDTFNTPYTIHIHREYDIIDLITALHSCNCNLNDLVSFLLGLDCTVYFM